MKYLNLLLILLAFVSLIPAYPVSASSVVLLPGAEGTDGHWGYAGAGSLGDYRNIQSNDDAVSYQILNTGGVSSFWVSSWAYDDLPAAALSVNSVTGLLRFNSSGCLALQHKLYYRSPTTGTRYYSSAGYASGAWTNLSHTWYTNPETGNVWTVSEVNAAEFGAYLSSTACGGFASSAYVSYLGMTVDYVSAAVPTVTTQAVSAITDTTATGNGNVTSDGGSAITERGTVISTSANPTTADTKDTAAGTTGVFTTSIGGLTTGVTYHVRAYAINAVGTSYGEDVSFVTLNTPAVTTAAASNIATTSAQLNGLVTNDGGQLADIRFAYDTSSHALFADYATITAWVNDTYSTGDYPYVGISGLTPLDTYYFRVQIRNDMGTVTGGELTFDAANAVNYPTQVTMIPYATRINVSWIKGTGASNTILRYSTATYPATSGSGTLGYSGTGNSVIITGLTPGTTIYISLWGLTSGTYSTSYATSVATTSAYDQPTGTGPTLTTPTADPTWTQHPSAAKVSTIPVVGEIIQLDATAFNQPVEYLWYFVWMMIASVIGIAVYMGGGHNYVLSAFSMLLWIGIGVWWLNVVAGGVICLISVIGVAWTLVGHRRTGG